MSEIWINPDKKHEYYKARDLYKTGYFFLIQVDGSLSSLIRYSSKEDAIKDGWTKKEQKDAEDKNDRHI